MCSRGEIGLTGNLWSAVLEEKIKIAISHSALVRIAVLGIKLIITMSRNVRNWGFLTAGMIFTARAAE